MSHGLPPPLRDPAPLLHKVRREWGGQTALWIFGYASLIWRPEFEAAEQRPASVHGWHRSLKMTSRVNRGTPDTPGLVFALVPGGSCRGMVYRLAKERIDEDLERLWQREMPTGVYDPKWLMCQTPQGPVRALAFTLSRRSPSFTGPIDDDAMLRILRHASGRYGRTLDYLVETATCLRACGIRDRSIERLVQLAKGHGLHHGHATAPVTAAATIGLTLQSAPADDTATQADSSHAQGPATDRGS